MFKLYYAPGTCALASHIALEEAGASYTTERLDFKSNLCSTVHVAHAHKGRGYRWAAEESSFADMKRKVPETMAACFALIERDMIKAPWVMGEQYTVCDPYLFT